MAKDSAREPSYGIFRTRFQPHTIAHDWAVDAFLHWSDVDASCTFEATDIILAIVDPFLKPLVSRLDRFTRFRPELNPFDGWQTSYMAHSMTQCGEGGTEHTKRSPDWGYTVLGSRCSRIVITQVPAFVLLREEEKQEETIRELCRRLPLGKKNVWYFPCFDIEDRDDILTLWDLMKNKTLPRMRVVVSHHPRFAYRCEEKPGYKGRDLGVYAASMFEMADFRVVGNTDHQRVLSETVRNLLDLKQGERARAALEKCRTKLRQRSDPLKADNGVNYVHSNELVTSLTEGFCEIFGEADPTPYLSFLPPDPNSRELRDFLHQQVLEVIRERLPPSEFQQAFWSLSNEIRSCLMPSAERARGILGEIVSTIDRKLSRKHGLSSETADWQRRFQQLCPNTTRLYE